MKLTIMATVLALQLARAAALPAQEYVVAVAEENFRSRPGGAKLGTLVKGAPVDALREQGRWVKGSLRGWIWSPSVSRIGSEVLVRAGRENVRAQPAAGGRLLGTVLRGTRLARLGERGKWVQVRYDGWIWEPSLAAGGPDPEGEPEAPGEPDPAPDSEARAPLPEPDRTLAVSEENLRTAPNGRRLGVLRRGADLATRGSRGSWLEATVHGYFWAPSASGSGSTRKVAPESENLRLAPGSEIVGVLQRGAPLRVLGQAGNWLEVRLDGWIWEPSTLALEPEEPVEPPATEAEASADGARAGPASDPAGAGPSPEAAGATPVSGDAASASEAASAPRTLLRSVPLKDAPEGTLIGQALTGGAVVPLRSAGDWVKIRVEGWIPKEALAYSAGAPGPVTVAMVTAFPDAYRGAPVTWTLELISVETADETRTDFRQGERYLLTRSSVGEREYVYVVIPERLVERFERLPAFAPLTVSGVVRAGRSALVGNPILELRELLNAAP